jgi:hypothetical protein
MSTEEIAKVAKVYREDVTVIEPKEAATSWHAHRLCRHCGSCVLYGTRPEGCPAKLRPDQVVLGPQGFGPARNIVAFTGGDILCKPEFYIEAAQKIKERPQQTSKLSLMEALMHTGWTSKPILMMSIGSCVEQRINIFSHLLKTSSITDLP